MVGSDEEALLIEAEEVAPRSWPRRVVLPGLLLALCSAAFVFMPRTQIVQAPSRLEQLIKLHALTKNGVHLDDQAIHGVVDRFRVKSGRFGHYVRRLSDNETEDAEVLQMLTDQFGLSKECAGALMETVEMMMNAIAEIVSDIMTKCFGEDMVPNGECTEEEMNAMAEKMFGDLAAKCQADGDACSVTVTDPEDAKAEPESILFCMPKECHDEAKQAVKALMMEEEELEEEQEGESDPDKKAANEKAMEDAMTIKCGE